MSHELEAIKEILKGVKVMIDTAMQRTTQIYDGVVLGEGKNGKWSVKYNGEVHLVKNRCYTQPQTNSIVKVYVPQGNHSTAWFEVMANPYPIGAVYISAVSTDPSLLFGGTWEKIEDVMLMAAGPDHPAGKTSGAFEITQTVEQMPSHGHSPSPYRETWVVKGAMPRREIAVQSGSKVYALTADEYDAWAVGETGLAGGSKPMDITNRNTAFYVWKRIG